METQCDRLPPTMTYQYFMYEYRKCFQLFDKFQGQVFLIRKQLSWHIWWLVRNKMLDNSFWRINWHCFAFELLHIKLFSTTFDHINKMFQAFSNETMFIDLYSININRTVFLIKSMKPLLAEIFNHRSRFFLSLISFQRTYIITYF